MGCMRITQYDMPFARCVVAKKSGKIFYLAITDDDALIYANLADLLGKDRGFSVTPGSCAELMSLCTRQSHLDQFWLHATPFQSRVWHTLCQIPRGQTVSYQEVAQQIGQPQAYRAVAHAVASNQIALLIPCHRVIYASGALGQYRWGSDVKKSILHWEGILLSG